MPSIGQTGGRHVGPWAGQLYGAAARYGQQGTGYKMAAIQQVLDDRQRMIASLLELRAYRERQRAAEAAEGGSGGAIGAGIGMAAAIVAAPFTAGASLALIPAAAAVGGGIGNAIDPARGGGPGYSRVDPDAFSNFTKNPYHQAQPDIGNPEESGWYSAAEAQGWGSPGGGLGPLPPNPIDPYSLPMYPSIYGPAY